MEITEFESPSYKGFPAVRSPNHKQTQAGGDWSGSWSELYSDSLTSLRVAENADGRLKVFGVNSQGHIWHTWQTQAGSDWSGGWSELYSDNDNLAMLDVGRNADQKYHSSPAPHFWPGSDTPMRLSASDRTATNTWILTPQRWRRKPPGALLRECDHRPQPAMTPAFR